jgi:hypothetical protein
LINLIVFRAQDEIAGTRWTGTAAACAVELAGGEIVANGRPGKSRLADRPQR